jgi:hypothetical protein
VNVSAIFSDDELSSIVTSVLDGRRPPASLVKRFREWLPKAEGQGFGEVHGTLLEHVEDGIDDVGLLEGYLDEDRLEELEDGAEPTAEEVELYRELSIASSLENPDYDVDPGFRVHEITDAAGRTIHAVLLVNGYSFSGVTYRFRGFFVSREAALSHLRTIGPIKVDGQPAEHRIRPRPPTGFAPRKSPEY